eukprot:1288972-Ditylum_brightwellii.AAC.1
MPPCSTHPNFKVDCWLKHVNNKSIEAWKLSSNISCDKQTQGFQGNHEDKQRITYKLDDQYYMCDLDNLYMSAKFTKLAFVALKTGQLA